jgi:vacuolar iron transporter family protein
VTVADALDNWKEEKRSAYLYRIVAQAEEGSARAGLFLELAADAEKQATIWERRVAEAGRRVPVRFTPGPRAHLVAALVRRFGPRPLRAILSAMKVRGMSLYSKPEPGHAARGEKRHKTMTGGGNLRAAVFGVNDGLVSNVSLIMGVAGAGADASLIMLTGIAGLIAGAFSMGAGEYVSVRSQRELFEYQIGLERDELEHYPQEEAEELALIYAARGMPKEEALRMAKNLIADPEHALDTLAREELGLNPEDLGSPVGAALYSFFSFAAGAAIPVWPFVFLEGASGLLLAIFLTAAALFAVGMILSLFTGRRGIAGGLRMLAIGSAAGAVTYLVGSLLGVSFG